MKTVNVMSLKNARKTVKYCREKLQNTRRKDYDGKKIAHKNLSKALNKLEYIKSIQPSQLKLEL